MDRELRQRVAQFLERHIGETAAERKAVLEAALHGCEVVKQIGDRDQASHVFIHNMIATLDSYGRCAGDAEPSLVVLIRSVGSQKGKNVQAMAAALCYDLLQQSIDDRTASTEAPILPPPSPNPRMRDHIFISYSHHDRAFVDRLAEDLRRQGYIMWVDFGGIRGGEVWRQSISDGIHASAIVMVVITPSALESEWVALEVKTAFDEGKPIIPIIIDALTPPDWKAYNQLGLDKIQYRDFTPGYDSAFKKLLVDLPKPQAGLPGYCQKLIARLANTPWGLDHYIQEEARILPIHASPYDEGLKQRESKNLLQHLWQGKRTIVLGEPGIGKSVALERLAWELASNAPPVVPILITLREYDGLPLLEWVRLKLFESEEEAIRRTLQKPEDTERFLDEMPFTFYLLLDGLNEVRQQYREQVLQEIRRLSLMYPQHPMVVTSRVQDESWRDLRGGSFDAETVVVQAITTQQAQRYLAAHLSMEDANELWRRLDERMQGLATTPLLLWLIKEAWLETRGRIPGNRGELYANFIERMLRRDDDRKLNTSISRESRLAGLEALALTMHKQKAVSLKREQVRAIIPDDVLEALLVNGLLQGEDIIRFAPHQTVQEHFAARAIQKEAETELNKPPSPWYRKIFSQPTPSVFDEASDPWWAETFIQLAGLTANPNRLAQKIAEINPWLAWWCVQEGQAVDPETERVIQAQSALLVDSEQVQDRRNAVQALLKLPQARVIDQLAKLAIDSDDSVADPARQALSELGEAGKLAVAGVFEERIIRYPPSERAQIGRWLSEWGDMRPGVGVRNGLPDIEWVTIPAGEFTYQDGKITLDYDYQIARYPVTYAQFQTFIDDPEGYQDTKRWFDRLAADDDDKQIRDQYFKYANHPRETVNWYQTIAFCRWLSWRLGGGYDLDAVDQWLVRLPTEFEWEKAARANMGWVYPWGDDYHEGYANIDETVTNAGQYYLGQTSAVGIYPQGDTRHWSQPISDLSGNVWEWCLTAYDEPQVDAIKENISTNTRRVLRGGSWYFDHLDARAAYRYYDDPLYRLSYFGFRLVRAPSL